MPDVGAASLSKVQCFSLFCLSRGAGFLASVLSPPSFPEEEILDHLAHGPFVQVFFLRGLKRIDVGDLALIAVRYLRGCRGMHMAII